MTNQVQKLHGEALSDEPIKTPLDVFKGQMERQKGEFLKALPSHISFEKFQRTVMTAVIGDPALLQADRQSLLYSAVKAATDGLLPDKREAAFVIFKSKGKDESGRDVWLDRVQYMPMYLGILKKVRQSDEVLSIVTHVVYQKDKFEYVLGDEERIDHKPYMGTEDRGPIIAAYCIAKLKDGFTVREVMTFQDIEKVRKTSKAGAMSENDLKYNKSAALGDPKGIWRDWYEEMARKTVFRRAAKWLPQKIEIIERAFENDDSMSIIEGVSESVPEVRAIEDKSEENAAAEMPDLKAEIEKKKAEEENKSAVPVEEVFPGDLPSKLI